MSRNTMDRLVINSPSYAEPGRETRSFDLAEGRRRSGQVSAADCLKAIYAPGVFVEIPMVNQIRPRMKAWRDTRRQHRRLPLLYTVSIWLITGVRCTERFCGSNSP